MMYSTEQLVLVLKRFSADVIRQTFELTRTGSSKLLRPTQRCFETAEKFQSLYNGLQEQKRTLLFSCHGDWPNCSTTSKCKDVISPGQMKKAPKEEEEY